MERIDDLERSGLKIIQDTDKFCFGMDAVLLSGFAKAKKGDIVLDMGTGTGILPILLSAKNSQIFIDKGCSFYNIDLATRAEYVCLKNHNSVSIDDYDCSELMATGNKNYPTSRLLKNVKTDNNCEFEGILLYKDIEHRRCLVYSDNIIEINDNINSVNHNLI